MTKKHTPNKSLDKVISVRLSKGLKEKLDKLFVDLPNDSAKVRYVVSEYFKFIERFPYLNIKQDTLNPEDAGFPPCDFVKVLYDRNEFIGFHCSLRRPLPNLPRIKVGRITFKLATPDLCWTCVETCKKSKLGIKLFSHITLESISEHKRKYKVKSARVYTGHRPKVNREEAFKLFALERPKKYVKKQLRISERTLWMLKEEYEALSPVEREKIKKSVADYS